MKLKQSSKFIRSSRVAATLLALGALSACGGGGSGDGPAINPALGQGTTIQWTFDNATSASSMPSSLVTGGMPGTITPQVTVVASTVVDSTSSAHGKALQFDPSHTPAYMRLECQVSGFNCNDLNFSWDHPQISVAMWIKPTSLAAGATYHLVGNGNSFYIPLTTTPATHTFQLRIEDKKLVFRLFPYTIDRDTTTGASKSNVIATSNSFIADGAWQHVAVTYDWDSYKVKIYINGVVDAQAVVPEALHDKLHAILQPLYMGGLPPAELVSPSDNPIFPGTIDDLVLSNGALTQADVTNLYTANTTPP